MRRRSAARGLLNETRGQLAEEFLVTGGNAAEGSAAGECGAAQLSAGAFRR
jgi:hypothetical protein